MEIAHTLFVVYVAGTYVVYMASSHAAAVCEGYPQSMHK